jgi:hypothetical protein
MSQYSIARLAALRAMKLQIDPSRADSNPFQTEIR